MGLPLKVAPEVRCLFQASVVFEIGDGRQALFWKDRWIAGASVEDIAPAVIELVAKRTRSSQSVAVALQGNQWIRELRGGLSVQAINQYLKLWDAVQEIRLSPSVPDRILWRWSSDGHFSVHSAYQLLHEGSILQLEIAIIWKTWAPLRIKIFLWLAWRRRLWTADRRHRHGLDARTACFLCDAADETCDHLLVSCSFSLRVWDGVLSSLGVHRPPASGGISVLDWWITVRELWPPGVGKGIDSLFALVTWEVWKERNARCFRGEVSSAEAVVSSILSFASEWVRAGAKALGCILSE
ncbi:hypothetical protein U9M48_027087 [Paspalum notatum var. saurae]|uniref:Reverse transcriptase zinc-binding domain-containing protein n=1 Tax=Paspalum notatum var. saurae TaxID=547442 RepID=A0AAQ3TTN9_PASNO